MSIAGRPTWAPAKGTAPSNRFISKAYSSQDLKSHTTLKVRQPGQNTQDEIRKRDLKAELLEREQRHFQEKDRETTQNDEREEEIQATLLLDAQKNIDADDSDESSDGDKDDDKDEKEHKSVSGSESDEEDETEQLLKELEKIKKEREEESSRRRALDAATEAADREEQMLFGNPLLNQQAKSAPEFNLKKRWFDDTVFKNQAKTESKQQKRFINDTIRNDFHKKFLMKYIK